MDEATSIQHQLNIGMSAELRDYLSNFPFSHMFVCRSGMVNLPSRIVQVTQELRSQGFFSRQWPLPYLSIGRDDLGNEFFIDTELETSPVFIADHERTSIAGHLVFQQAEVSIHDWVDVMLQTERETPQQLKECFED